MVEIRVDRGARLTGDRDEALFVAFPGDQQDLLHARHRIQRQADQFGNPKTGRIQQFHHRGEPDSGGSLNRVRGREQSVHIRLAQDLREAAALARAVDHGRRIVASITVAVQKLEELTERR